MTIVLIFIFLFNIHICETFIVGGCIGPKSVLERYLNDKQKMSLRKMVHNNFDGSNSEKILEMANRFVFGHVTEQQWHTIVPELAEYQSKKHECSLYAQLLPKTLYQQLLKSVLRASEMGASKYDVKRLVDDYVERLAKAGVLPDVVEEQTRNIVVPERNSDGYRNMPPKRPKKPAMKKLSVHPKLISSETKTTKPVTSYPDIPVFPIARPSSFELNQYGSSRNRGGNHRTPPQRYNNNNMNQNYNSNNYINENFNNKNNNNQMHECDYYAGPCATSF